MTYQVIARKWRPQTFDEVTGQEHITRTLRNAVEHERLHHAYLFSGARGVGKTTTARLLAKAVNCHRSEKPTPTPCRTTDADACPSCREIAEGRSIDVLEIDAASNTGVDNVRESIINTIGVRAARDRFKVFIIDEVHMLSVPAFNALLKTLEEPPPRVLFIMATTHAHKVPETILSRSQQFEFRTIAAAKIAERLRLIADAEKIKVSDDALREIARAGEGSMRDAQSAFDQVISFSEGKIETADVEAALGLAGTELLSRVMRAVADAKPADALAVVDDLVMRGHDLRNFCRDLLAHLRGLLVVKVAGDSPALADATEAERKELLSEARDFSESDLVRFFHSLTETETRLRESAHPRYQLEIGLVKLIEMRRLASLSQIVERLGALEEALRTGRAPDGAGPGAQTPPAPNAPAGTPTRGGGAAGGRGGAASFSNADAESTTPSMTAATPTIKAVPLAATPPPDSRGPSATSATPTPQSPSATSSSTTAPPPSQTTVPANSAAPTPSPAPPTSTPAPTPSNFGAGRAATATASNLKLVQPASGGAPDAPFPLTNGDAAQDSFFGAPEPRSFFEEVRAGQDRVGNPVSLRPVSSPSPGGATAAAPVLATPAEEPTDAASLVKRGLEGRSKPLLAAALDGARRMLTEGEEVYVEFAPDTKHLRDTLSRPENMKLLREVCCEVLGRQVGVRVEVRVPGESADVPLTQRDEERLEQQRLREFAENHPLVQKVLKTFRAEIIEVKRVDNGQ